jgi:hypothetical protein
MCHLLFTLRGLRRERDTSRGPGGTAPCYDVAAAVPCCLRKSGLATAWEAEQQLWAGGALRHMSLVLVLLFACNAMGRGAEPLNVAPNGSFELDQKRLGGWLPVGVAPDPECGDYGIAIVDDVAHRGRRALQIRPGPAGTTTGLIFFADHNGGEGKRRVTQRGGVRGARTFAMRLERDIASLAAAAWIRRTAGASVRLTLIWTTRRQRRSVIELRRDGVAEPTRSEAGWELFAVQADRPDDACQVQLVIETDAQQPLYVDDVVLTMQRAPQRQLLVDQLGYETASQTKSVVLQSSTPLADLPMARVVDVATAEEVLTVPWVDRGYLPTWDRYHWTADFSELDRPGRYVITLGPQRDATTSAPFSIRDDLVVAETGELAYRFYYYQRCGIEVPGFHAACHLDDARLADGKWVDLTGGWHDAGDYNKYNGLTPEAVESLMLAYHFKPARFDRWDRDQNGRADILDEAWWGAQLLSKMLDPKTLELRAAVSSGYRYWGPPEKETDNRPGTGDERPVQPGNGDTSHCVAGFALLGKYLAAGDDSQASAAAQGYLGIAKRMYAKTGGGLDRLVPLEIATANDPYRQAARRRAEQLLDQQGDGAVVGFRELGLMAIAFPEEPLVTRIRPLAARRVAELQTLCDATFGIARRPGPDGQWVYCRPYADVNDWYVGETSHRLDVAIDALIAARLGQSAGRKIAENQVHWLLGRNPLGVSMMEGVGSRFVPQYHHRYNAIAGNPRGAVPGALINGFVRAWPAIDRPWLDLHGQPNADYHSNEPWLLHNNRWLVLLALW